MSFKSVTKTSMRDLLEQVGKSGASRVIRESIAEGKIRPEDFSVREVWEACIATERKGGSLDVMESVNSSMFPTVMGEIISAEILKAFKNAAAIGDKLCTTVPSSHKTEKIVGFNSTQKPDQVLEGEEYGAAEFDEKFSEVTHLKWGKTLKITQEAVAYDQTNQILSAAQGIGEKAAGHKERLIVEGILDIDGEVWKPGGIATALYSIENGNLCPANVFGDSGLKAAGRKLHLMSDSDGDFILHDPKNMIMLAPWDLFNSALEMTNSTLVPEGLSNAKNVWEKSFTPLTSPYVTKRSATDWLFGNFAAGFRWSEVWPLQVFAMKGDSDQMFMRDLAAVYKTRFLGALTATFDCPKYVVKSQA